MVRCSCYRKDLHSCLWLWIVIQMLVFFIKSKCQMSLTRCSACMASAHDRMSIHSWQLVSMLDARRSSSVAHVNFPVTTARASVMTCDWAEFMTVAGCLGWGWLQSCIDLALSSKWVILLAGVTSVDCGVTRTSASDALVNCLIWVSRARHLAAEELTAETSQPLHRQQVNNRTKHTLNAWTSIKYRAGLPSTADQT